MTPDQQEPHHRPGLLLVSAVACGVAAASCGYIGKALPLAKAAAPFAGIKLAFQCVPEGTMVDTPDGPRAIELVRPDDLVTGFSGRPVRVRQAHAYAEDPRSNGFLRIGFSSGAEVELCRRHRLSGTRAMDLRLGDPVDGHTVSRITAFGGVKRSYDLLTGDEGYRIDGVPVNSMIEEMYRSGLNGMPNQ